MGKIRIADNKIMVIIPNVSFTIDGENRYIELVDSVIKTTTCLFVLKHSIFTSNPIVIEFSSLELSTPALKNTISCSLNLAFQGFVCNF